MEDTIEGSVVPTEEAKPTEDAKARRRPRPRAELEAEGQEIARRRQDDPGPWACSRCDTGEQIPGTAKNCPKCGHVRGAKPDQPELATEPEPDPEPVEGEPVEAAQGLPDGE
jgi:hypothetical protein